MKRNLLFTLAFALAGTFGVSAQTADVGKPVYNETTSIGYDNIADAFAAISSDETCTLVITGNVEVGSRLMFDASKKANVTFKGKDENAALVNRIPNAIMFVMKGGAQLTFEDITIDGNNNTKGYVLVEADNRALTLRNVSIKNYSSTHANGLIDVKSNAWGVFENVKVENCEQNNFFNLNKNSYVKGVNAFKARLASGIFMVNDGVQEGNMITVDLAAPAAGVKVVEGCDNADLFSLSNAGFKIEVSEGNLVAAVDAGVEIPTAVTIEGKDNVGYENITDALNGASEGDVILVNEDQRLSSRFTIGKAVTIKGGKDGITILNGHNNQAYIVNGKAVTIENITLDGDNKTGNNYIGVEGNGGNLTLKNVVIKNYTFKNENNNKLIHVKNANDIHLKGVTVENVSGPETVGMVNINRTGSTISGNNNISLHLNGTHTIAVADGATLAGDPVKIFLTDHAVDSPVVTGHATPTSFNVMKDGYKFEAKDGNLVLAEDNESAVSEIEAAGDGAPVEYYNMQGVKVYGDPAPGLYIRRQGDKTVKVIVK